MPVNQVLVQKHILSSRDGRSQLSGGYLRLRSPPTACHNSASRQERSRPQGMRTLSSHDSTRQNVPGLEVSANPDIPGLTCSRSITLVAAYSTLLTAGTAAAYGDSTGMSYMQPAWVESASQNMDALILADFSLLPSFNGQPFQILGFLLNHPFVTLALALTVNYVVPRAFRAVVRFLVVPLVLGSIAWVVLQNPSTALDLLRGTFDCEHLAFPNLRYHDPAWCTDLSMCMICICMQRRMDAGIACRLAVTVQQ